MAAGTTLVAAFDTFLSPIICRAVKRGKLNTIELWYNYFDLMPINNDTLGHYWLEDHKNDLLNFFLILFAFKAFSGVYVFFKNLTIVRLLFCYFKPMKIIL